MNGCTGINDGVIREMKYCKCKIPKEWSGDNYCRNCNGLIESKLTEAKARSNGKAGYNSAAADIDPNTFEGQAKILLNDINNPTALRHWLYAQDFFIDENIGETGEVLPDAAIAGYLQDAGANNKQTDYILKIVHEEDPD